MRSFLQGLLRSGFCIGLVVVGCGASAGTIDFIGLADGAVYGESAYNPLTLVTSGITVNITGHDSVDDDVVQYAYLDANNAGLGVCSDLNSGALTGPRPSLGSNICDPASDDNVTTNESLEFVFDEDVFVDLWFNNNHDGGFDATDRVTINSVDYAVATGYAGGANSIGTFIISAGEKLIVAFGNEQFYVSAMEVRAVPVPAAVWLFGSALIGLASVARRRAVKL